MTPLPKHLEEIRQWVLNDEPIWIKLKEFVNQYDIMLKDMESMAKALDDWHSWEQEQIKKEGPYVGKAINQLIKNAGEALKNYREKYKGEIK